MAIFPGMQQIAEVGQQVREFVVFGHAALTTIIQNQHAIAGRIANIERNLGISDQPALRPIPALTVETIENGHGGN